MQAGAAGLSLGLMYVPGLYTPARELVRIAQTVSNYNGVVTAHMRGEGDHLLTSVAEMIALAEKASVAVHISHLKVTGRKNWGTIQRTLERIEDARAHGLDITVDVYPYNAGSTTMTQLLPPWIQEGGIARMLERLRNPAMQQRVLKDFAQGIAGWENQVGAIGWENVYIAGVQYDRYKSLEGLNLVEASNMLGLTPEQAFFHLLLQERGQITVILFMMDERDVDQVVQSSFSMLGSDGLPIVSGRPHPRLYGTFPRFIQRYVREQKSLQL
jgi:N-acyl-D-aspartate/D-glutamate deacylase